ncbi:hypothetical protein E4T56_gene7160, partial [Termitomyces sp. T112]
TFFIVARALDAAAPHGGQTAVKASHYYDSDASRKFQTPPCRRIGRRDIDSTIVHDGTVPVLESSSKQVSSHTGVCVPSFGRSMWLFAAKLFSSDSRIRTTGVGYYLDCIRNADYQPRWPFPKYIASVQMQNIRTEKSTLALSGHAIYEIVKNTCRKYNSNGYQMHP